MDLTDKLTNVSGFCAYCGEKIFRHPAGMWRHVHRNYLECYAEQDVEDLDWWEPDMVATPDVQVSI